MNKEVKLGSICGTNIVQIVSPKDYKKALNLKLKDTALENAILKQELDQANSKIEKIKDLITEIIDLALISVVVNFKEQKEKEKMLEVFKSMQNGIDKIIGEE